MFTTWISNYPLCFRRRDSAGLHEPFITLGCTKKDQSRQAAPQSLKRENLIIHTAPSPTSASPLLTYFHSSSKECPLPGLGFRASCSVQGSRTSSCDVTRCVNLVLGSRVYFSSSVELYRLSPYPGLDHLEHSGSHHSMLRACSLLCDKNEPEPGWTLYCSQHPAPLRTSPCWLIFHTTVSSERENSMFRAGGQREFMNSISQQPTQQGHLYHSMPLGYGVPHQPHDIHQSFDAGAWRFSATLCLINS